MVLREISVVRKEIERQESEVQTITSSRGNVRTIKPKAGKKSVVEERALKHMLNTANERLESFLAPAFCKHRFVWQERNTLCLEPHWTIANEARSAVRVNCIG